MAGGRGREGRRGVRQDIRTLVLTPDGQRAAYAIQSGRKWRVVVDGKESAEYHNEPDPIVFSPDGKHVSYVARRSDQWLVVLDGHEGAPYDEIRAPRLAPTANASLTRPRAATSGWWCSTARRVRSTRRFAAPSSALTASASPMPPGQEVGTWSWTARRSTMISTKPAPRPSAPRASTWPMR